MYTRWYEEIIQVSVNLSNLYRNTSPYVLCVDARLATQTLTAYVYQGLCVTDESEVSRSQSVESVRKSTDICRDGILCGIIVCLNCIQTAEKVFTYVDEVLSSSVRTFAQLKELNAYVSADKLARNIKREVANLYPKHLSADW